MTKTNDGPQFIFPPWTNALPLLSLGGAVLGLVASILIIWYYFSPRHTDVGYRPVQPIPFSHQLHSGTLGLDCRYCHVNVERSPVASVPPTQVCMNCHLQIRKGSPLLNALRQSYISDLPVRWVRVHKLPDYVYFDHSRHVTRGVGCVECHGHIERMVTVFQHQPLSMSWCLNCHRQPAAHIRTLDMITQADWDAPQRYPGQPLEEARAEFGRPIVARENIAPPTHCSGCHR